MKINALLKMYSDCEPVSGEKMSDGRQTAVERRRMVVGRSWTGRRSFRANRRLIFPERGIWRAAAPKADSRTANVAMQRLEESLKKTAQENDRVAKAVATKGSALRMKDGEARSAALREADLWMRIAATRDELRED